MKKRNLVLDFTPLLDIILIILFVVIVNMNQTASSAVEKANQSLSDVQTQNEMLSEELDEAKSQLDDMSAISGELEELQDKYALLMDEYEYLKITSDYDPDDISVYEEAIKRTDKVLIQCESSDGNTPYTQQVSLKIYLNQHGSDSPTYADTLTLVHDFSLNKSQRDQLNARQVVDVTRALSSLLRNSPNDIIWFSIQYDYDDENISNADIEIIRSAADNLSRNFSRSCFCEEIKLY